MNESVRETVDITNERGQTRRYETVASRLARFRADHPDYAIVPEILQVDDEVVRMRVSICVTYALPDGHMQSHALAIAHAEEYRGSGEINATSALENCETSAIGRALAFFGYGSAESIASAEEVIGAKAKATSVAQAQPGALILLQQAAQKGYKALESCWKNKLSEDDRNACRGQLAKLKKSAKQIDDAD